MIKLYVKLNIKLLIYRETTYVQRNQVASLHQKMREKTYSKEQHSRQRYKSMTCIFT